MKHITLEQLEDPVYIEEEVQFMGASEGFGKNEDDIDCPFAGAYKAEQDMSQYEAIRNRLAQDRLQLLNASRMHQAKSININKPGVSGNGY